MTPHYPTGKETLSNDDDWCDDHHMVTWLSLCQSWSFFSSWFFLHVATWYYTWYVGYYACDWQICGGLTGGSGGGATGRAAIDQAQLERELELDLEKVRIEDSIDANVSTVIIFPVFASFM